MHNASVTIPRIYRFKEHGAGAPGARPRLGRRWARHGQTFVLAVPYDCKIYFHPATAGASVVHGAPPLRPCHGTMGKRPDFLPTEGPSPTPAPTTLGESPADLFPFRSTIRKNNVPESGVCRLLLQLGLVPWDTHGTTLRLPPTPSPHGVQSHAPRPYIPRRARHGQGP